MGELGSDFSLGGERGIKREEEKETSTNLCPWFGQPAGTDSTSLHSLPAWIIICVVVVLDLYFGWHCLRGKRFPPLGKVQEFVLEQSEERRREDSSNFSPHLSLHRRFFCGRMGAGAMTICVSRNYKEFGSKIFH